MVLAHLHLKRLFDYPKMTLMGAKYGMESKLVVVIAAFAAAVDDVRNMSAPEMAVFWVVAPSRTDEFTSVSEFLMLGTVGTSEALVNSYHSTQLYNPEDNHLRVHCRENIICLCPLQSTVQARSHKVRNKSQSPSDQQPGRTFLSLCSMQTRYFARFRI
jgi:hypothetical protein